ncbi:hypothetical protein BP5796_11589 [Coleophoma crateriformis]|uniref:Uncharacterized protein n=1 Tax=Coleophoma crateriformis TaxID=565419 RepID=A0A3D8QDR0_9HELO|nr:hypothetical protein BP5796_11589 [Coleophoma crateriformis]
MTEWLRPKFQRTPSSFLDEVPCDVDRPDRVRASSRVSSYLGLSRPPTPSVPPTDIFGSKAPHVVYEKPSVDQMVETLKVAMMTKDSMEALHPQYNSSILHTLEAYSDMKEQLDEKGRIIEELKQGHTKERKQFEERAASWRAKEEDYKLEMKHLEVLLANTEGGMEKVSMARTHSMLHTESRDRAITPRVRSPETLAVRVNLRNRRNLSKGLQRTMQPPSSPQIDRQNTPGIDIHNERGLQLDDMEKFSRSPLQNPDNLELGLIPVNSNASGQEHIETDLGIVFESSDSSTSASDSMGSSYSRKTMEKPLPAIPFTSTTSKGTFSFLDDALYEVQLPSSPWVEVTPADQNFPSRKGFSYRPGDDSPELFSTAELPRARAKPAPASGPRRLGRSDTLQRSQRDLSSEVVKTTHVAKPRRARPHTLNSTSGAQSGQSGTLHSRDSSSDYDVSRGNSSTSSIVTAIRDNSGRSSAASASQTPSNHPRLNRHAGSSETAAIAAARAVASRSGSAHGENALPKWPKPLSNPREDERKQISRHGDLRSCQSTATEEIPKS